jgi:hypothetical protein
MGGRLWGIKSALHIDIMSDDDSGDVFEVFIEISTREIR